MPRKFVKFGGATEGRFAPWYSLLSVFSYLRSRQRVTSSSAAWTGTRSRFHKWTKVNQEEDGGDDCAEFKEGRVKFVHDSANFLSRLTYFWLDSMLRLGSSRPLEFDDLGDLPSVDKADVNHQRFSKVWEKEKIRAAEHKKCPSLWRAHFLAYRVLLVKSGLCRLCGDLLSFIGPLCLKQIVKYVETTSKSGGDGEVEPVSKTGVYFSFSEFFSNGFVLSVVIFLDDIIVSFFIQYQFYIITRLCMNLRASLQVYLVVLICIVLFWICAQGTMQLLLYNHELFVLLMYCLPDYLFLGSNLQ